MTDDTIDISDIDVTFGGDNEPQDKYLMELLKQAFSGAIMCREAIVPIKLIKPFSDFTPKISEAYRQEFIAAYTNRKPPELYVYEKDDVFIMSDDYISYYLYLEVNSSHAICVIIGQSSIENGVKYGPEFKLPPPTIEIRNKQ